MDVPAPLNIENRGRERYAATWQRQLDLHQLRREGTVEDTLILVEHEPVVTLGRSGDMGNLLTAEGALAAAGVDFYRIERGGDITFHGPGQLVGYPIFDLRRLEISPRTFMHDLEDVFICVCRTFGVECHRIEGLTGVWCGDSHYAQKVCALGVAIRGGVSYHGFALNVSTDLSGFSRIVPCGIGDHGVTSLSALLEREVALSEVIPVVVEQFCAVFELAPHFTDSLTQTR